MVKLFSALVGGTLLAFSSLHAALITSHTDLDTQPAAADGIISANEYGLGNAYSYTGGGAGFGGQLGPATMYMKGGLTNLFIGFSNLGVHTDGNQYILYFHTRTGGYQPNGTDMNDGVVTNIGDNGRRNVSTLSLNGTETVTFNDGSTESADFALVFNNQDVGSGGFGAFYEMRPAGQEHVYSTASISGLGTSTLEIQIPLNDIAVAPGSSIEFMATLVGSSGWLSNEGIPDPGILSNPEFNDGNTTTFGDFHRFITFSANSYTGILERKENTTLNFPQEIPPETTNSFTTENALGSLTFDFPMHVTTAPGETNRLYVLERAGAIYVITNLLNPDKTAFMTVPSVNTTWEGGAQGIAFHPEYVSNRQFFVFYTRTHNNGTGNGFHTRLSRFLRNATNENSGLSGSETVFFSQFNQSANHNGGDIHFSSNDGYLYVALGDEGDGNDSYNNSQDLDKDFFSGLMRIDVDMKAGNLPPNHHPALDGATNYAVPSDNPFIGITSYYGSAINTNALRTEFFATGLRNPFRFHIDNISGLIYVADVGQSAWEEVNLVTNGGNYGWAGREGFAAGPKNFGFSATDYANPILAYGHGGATNQGNSITGGVVYRGNKYPQLVGHYIYADYQSGNIWALTHDGQTNTSNKRIASDNRIVGMGIDPNNGDVLMCDLFANQVKRLVIDGADTNGFPSALSDAGVFSDFNTLDTFEGIVPYKVNLNFWSDNAIKTRWFSVPDMDDLVTFDPEGYWAAPTTTVWIKHFDLLLTSGVPSSATRLETRVLVKNNTVDGGYGVTYRWGNSTEDAVLVPAEGLDEEFIINDSGIIRTQIWRYPSREDCLTCHTPQSGFALSFNTPQMHCVNDFSDTVTNQIRALENAGYFANSVGSLNLLRKLAHPTNEAYSLTYRVRSYLQANCSQCHYPGGPTPAGFDTTLLTSLRDTQIIDGELNDYESNPTNRVVTRGDIAHSMLLSRISFRGPGQMPPLGSNLLDTQNIALVTAWITGEAAAYETFEEWQLRNFGSTVSAESQPESDPDGDGGDNYYEYLTRTQPTNEFDVVDIELDPENEPPAMSFSKTAGVGFDVQVSTNLIEGDWTSIDSIENAPVFEGTTQTQTVPDYDATNMNERYYRIKAYEP